MIERVAKTIRIISIHALRGEGDLILLRLHSRGFLFQSTPSVGRATGQKAQRKDNEKYFNPRPPWGGRRAESPKKG